MTNDRQLWLRFSLPATADVVDCFSAEFGRDAVKVTFASENGHVLGKRFEVAGVKLSETLLGPMVTVKRDAK